MSAIAPGKTTASSSIACGLAAGAVLVATTTPFMGRYGWERDELYFLSASRRPSLGYVDFPPVTAWIGWLVHALAGNSLVALRTTGLACGVLSAVLVALMARELGGRWASQLSSAFAWVTTPFVLWSGALFHTLWFDLLGRVAFLYVALRLLGRRETRLWPLLGLMAGIGLETKYTILPLLLTFVAGLLVTQQRRLLRTGGPWIAAAVALLAIAPNLVWQASHGWASVHFFAGQHAFTAAATSRKDYVAHQVLYLGAVSIIAAVGAVRLWMQRSLRPLAIATAGVVVVFFIEKGQGTYPLPVYALALAAGAVAFERWRAGWRPRAASIVALVGVHATVLAFMLPYFLPIESTETMVRTGRWRPTGLRQTVFQEEIGWPELAEQTARAWRSSSVADRRRGAVLAYNYGEASALELFWPPPDRPTILSGHLNWQYWRPARLDQQRALVVGFPSDVLDRLCVSWRVRDRIENRWRLANEERGQLVASCRLRAPLGRLWRALVVRNRF